MFDLQREVDAWSQKSYEGSCRNKAATLDELKDHLYCEVERLEAEGKPREEAFRMATAKLGDHVGNVSESRSCWTNQRGRVANAILWAAVMIATAILLSKGGAKDTSAYLLLIVLMPAWYISDVVLARHLSTAGNH